MARTGANGLGTITNLEKMAAFLKSFVWCPVYGERVTCDQASLFFSGRVLSTLWLVSTNQRKVLILDSQQTNSQVIVSGVPFRREKKNRMPDRRLGEKVEPH